MENVLCMQKALEAKMKKHLDLADTWYESGDLIAYNDHMQIAESILMRMEKSTECPQID